MRLESPDTRDILNEQICMISGPNQMLAELVKILGEPDMPGVEAVLGRSIGPL